ncbi:hypothetical protein [Pseudomonas sp. E102]|uniref:hypothetical protein n=1 Tax=Pseudomonas sp. E102 TaxID=181579 RepID=UPI0040455BD7
MTTFEEIGHCPTANHRFWSERARLNLACYRYTGASSADRRLERAGFLRNMAHRRAQTYLMRMEAPMDLFEVVA